MKPATPPPGSPRLNGYWYASESWPAAPIAPPWVEGNKKWAREFAAGVEDFRRWAETDIGKKRLGARKKNPR